MGIQSVLGITSDTGEDPGGAWFTGEDEFAGGSGTVTRALGCVAAKAAAVGFRGPECSVAPPLTSCVTLGKQLNLSEPAPTHWIK